MDPAAHLAHHQQHAQAHAGHAHVRSSNIDELTDEEASNAAWTVMMLFIFMLVAQGLLVWWKKRYYRSYQNTTLVLLWLLPVFFAAQAFFIRFIICWLIYSAATAYIIFQATRKPLAKHIPRLVYRSFTILNNVCNVIAIMGYAGVMAGLFMNSQWTFASGGLLCFYGLYFGIVTRDCAEMCADRMASTMGYSSSGGLPSRSLPANICALCDNQLLVTIRANEDDSANERTNQLDCGHQFHEACIRGWCLIGKKDTCPYCNEKVRTKAIFRKPWETQSHFWAQLLDGVRYVIVWNPIILFFCQFIINYAMPPMLLAHLQAHAGHAHAAPGGMIGNHTVVMNPNPALMR